MKNDLDELRESEDWGRRDVAAKIVVFPLLFSLQFLDSRHFNKEDCLE